MRLSQRHPPPGIAAAVLWLPPGRDAADTAIADGRIDQHTAGRMGYQELSRSDDQAAPELAVLATRKAMADAGWRPDDVGLLVHAWIYHQGHDLWSPPHYIARAAGLHRALPVGIQQMCNGGAAAVEVATSRMIADPSVTRAVVTTADVFAEPGFSRWGSDFGVAYGDAATALLIDRDGSGPFRLLAVSSTAAPELEAMHRGADSFSAGPGAHSAVIDARRTKVAYMTAGGGEQFGRIVKESVLGVVRQALDDAGLTADDPALRYLALPRLGADVLDLMYRPRFADLGLRHATPLDLGRRTGHVGAGDAAANLADIHAQELLAPGEVALLLSAGGGFTWSCLVVQAQ